MRRLIPSLIPLLWYSAGFKISQSRTLPWIVSSTSSSKIGGNFHFPCVETCILIFLCQHKYLKGLSVCAIFLSLLAFIPKQFFIFWTGTFKMSVERKINSHPKTCRSINLSFPFTHISACRYCLVSTNFILNTSKIHCGGI